MSDGPIFLDLGVPGAGPPPDTEALRERAATALERASHFIGGQGGALAQARTWALLEAQPAAEAVRCLAAQQKEDGSSGQTRGDPVPLDEVEVRAGETTKLTP